MNSEDEDDWNPDYNQQSNVSLLKPQIIKFKGNYILFH